MLYYDGKGRYQKECGEMWRALVPAKGQAETVQGELLRIITRLEDECFRNGNGNWNRGYRMFTDFLARHLPDAKVFEVATLAQIRSGIEEIRDYGSGKKNPHFHKNEEDVFDRLTDRIVEWCQHHREPIPHVKNLKLKR